ncbi:MAG: two pore domain potassium channel family protein [Candidatus Aenigmarchaeota archaeon]|nr:two pore domain potassium channel family protein [Candidatus Aenigmarchaeota archaeon]
MRTLLKILGLFMGVVFLTGFGTVMYHNIEKWSYLNSFYFTGVTLLTIGYGDITPVTDIGKIFTVFFGFSGIGMVLLTLTIMSQHFFEQQERIRHHTQERAKHIIKKHIKHVNKIRRDILKGSRH